MASSYKSGAGLSLTQALLGFFGGLATLFILPRALKFVGRRFFLSALGEVAAVVVAGLLTEKAVDRAARPAPEKDR